MRWLPDPSGACELILRCQGKRVAWIERDRGRFLARIRCAPLDLIGVFTRRDEACRFVERELWSEAGELAPASASPRPPADADAFWLLRDLARAAARPVHGTLRHAPAESSPRKTAATSAPHHMEKPA